MDAELLNAPWRKSTHSQANGDCVEVVAVSGSRVAIRDSKNPAGPALVIASAQWRIFLARSAQPRSAQ